MGRSFVWPLADWLGLLRAGVVLVRVTSRWSRLTSPRVAAFGPLRATGEGPALR